MAKEASENISYTGVVSFILGLLSLAIPISGLILALFGLIFGIVQLSKGKNSWAIWGIVLSLLGIALNIMLVLGLVNLLSEVAAKVQEMQSAGLLSGQLPPIPQ